MLVEAYIYILNDYKHFQHSVSENNINSNSDIMDGDPILNLH